MNVGARDGGSRRVVVWIIAAVLIVGVIVGIGQLRHDGGGTSTVDTPVATSEPATAASTSTTPAVTTAAPTTDASRTIATVDLTAAVETLQPEQIASFPIAPPGDLFPTAFATTTPSGQIAILDDVTGVVRFIDASTRMEIAQYPTSIPTIGSQSFIAGYFFVGPDGVFYLNESGADGLPAMVAYARSGDSYEEIARVSHGIGDSTLTLGRSGVSVVGVADPIMPYVGVDGRPTGATLDLDELNVTSTATNEYTVERAGHVWSVTYVIPTDAGLPDSDSCVICPGAYLGPNATVVLVVKSPTTDGDLQTMLTVLSDNAVTYSTDWNYIGTIGGRMLFDRLDQDSIDIGTVQI